ncbi:hypothetical protein BQ8482_110192 [Mesorhizobium delmotii]|uniref:Uncharacterized protein n=1 Tax=Mesorhizobium delmotii TaxID=1631247 RepID=A0A2P9AAU7_9HYPH|nr:hypothetical protein BQ8482_110192 [Mesorhizobium delmotii]
MPTLPITVKAHSPRGGLSARSCDWPSWPTFDEHHSSARARTSTVPVDTLSRTEHSYREHNPGSRERVPGGFAPPTTSQVADAIIEAVERNKRLKVRPALFRILFALEAMVPEIMARQSRWATASGQLASE